MFNRRDTEARLKDRNTLKSFGLTMPPCPCGERFWGLMCGIAGFCQFKPGLPLKMKHLEAMTETIKHRGPADKGIYQKGPVGLGMTRLAIVDVAGGAQPISNERGNIWVVGNGEIYNHQELRGPLEEAGHHFSSRTRTLKSSSMPMRNMGTSSFPSYGACLLLPCGMRPFKS